MKKLTAALLALCLILGLGACGSGGDTVRAETIQRSVTLRVVTSYGGDDGNRRNFERAVEAYETDTGVRVKDESSLSNEEWKNKVMTDFMTGSDPDVLFYFTNADANPIINADRVVSIEEIREEFPDYAANMKPSMMAVGPDGKHYAVPSSGFWEALFVNKTVLDKCGIPLPGEDYTWEQFLQDCAVIRSRGYTPIACSLAEIPHYWFEFTVLNNGNLTNHLNLPKLDIEGHLFENETSAKWVAALEDIRQLYESRFFPMNTLTATDAQTVEMFAEGEAAFLVDGSWKVGFLTDNYPDHLEDYTVRFVPGKGERPASEAIGGISMGYFITRKAWEDPDKREAAVKFVSHMTSEEILSGFVTTEVTALVNGAHPVGLNVLQQSAADANTRLTGVTGAVQDRISGDAKSELFSRIPDVVTGRITAEQAVEAAMKQN